MTTALGSERIVNRVMESFTRAPSIDNLIEEVVNLLGQSVIAEHAEAKQLLESRLNQVSYRNGTDPLEGDENRFYNFCKQLIDTQGNVNAACLNLLKPIDLGDSLETKTISGLIKRLEHQEDRMGALIERTERLWRSVEEERLPVPFHNQEHYDYSKPYEVYETVFEVLKHSKFEMTPGAQLDKEGVWHLNNSRVNFFNAHLLPERNFMISLFFKTTQPNCGLFSIVGSGTSDRNLCLKNGQPNHRLYHDKTWKEWTGTAKNHLNDGKWHKWEFVVLDGKGQTAYIDGEEVGKNPVDHSDFDWKSEVIVGYSSNGGREFVGKIKQVMISAIRRHEVVFSAFRSRKDVLFFGGNVSYKEGSWHIKKGSWLGFNQFNHLPDRNFKISLCFKTAEKTCGIFSFTGGSGHDRHFCLKQGKPYHRIWTTCEVNRSNAWFGSTNKMLSDNNWHKWDLEVRDGFGQRAYIDGELIGESPVNHSDFNSKTGPCIGWSEDEKTHFEGKIKNVLVYAL